MTDFDPKAVLAQFLSNKGMPPQFTELTADASTRHYFRVNTGKASAVACVYPERQSESARNYLDVTELLLEQGLPVAHVLDTDPDLDVILLEDLGDTILREYLTTVNTDEQRELTKKAITLIAKMQASTAAAVAAGSIASKLRFDKEKLMWEFNFFIEHYFKTAMKRPLDGLEHEAIRGEFETIAMGLESRASVLCHRDFHAANLMVTPGGKLRIIDHQDARLGSPAYDLVSLLLDRVESVPAEDRVSELRRYFLNERTKIGLPSIDEDAFATEFRLQAIQRCLKAVGTFSYQSAVRGKTYFIPFIRPMFQIADDSAARLGRFPVLSRIIAREIL